MEQTINHKNAVWHDGKISGFSSNEILNQENGDLKYLKVEPGAEYPEHIHPDKTEYAVVMEGNPQITINTQNYSANPGDVFLFPPHAKHAISNKMQQTSILIIGSLQTSELP